jgi:hypothetical protein
MRSCVGIFLEGLNTFTNKFRVVDVTAKILKRHIPNASYNGYHFK